ncbi:MAG: hypothetical protein ACI8T1_000442 [Verrucomicrobiales bacterium]
MKSLGKGLLYAFILIVALGFLVLLGANLYLRSPGIRDKVVDKFQVRFGTKVSYESISYLPWRGLKVSRLEMAHQPDVAALTKEPFAHIEAVVAKVSLWSLIDRPIQLAEIRVVRPKITTLQRHDGSVALPWVTRRAPPMIAMTPTDLALTAPPEMDSPAELAVVDPIIVDPSVADSKEVTDASSAPPAASAVPASRGLEVLLARFRVTDGALVLLSPTAKRALVSLEGIGSEIDLGALEQYTEDAALGRLLGRVSVRQGDVGGVVRALGIQSEVHLRNDGALALPNIEATSDGGLIEGSLIGDPRKAGFPFQVRLGFRDLGVRSMAKRATSRVAFSRGAVEGMIEAEGFLAAPQTWRGRGNVAMNKAALARNGLLESLGRYIGVREFVELEFEEATAVFQLKGPVVWFEDIHWKTDNLEFKGLGGVGMNQRVKLGARLYFSQRVRDVLHRIERQLPDHVIREFGQVEGREDFYRDFVISGPLNQLRANFIGSEGRTFEEVIEMIRVSGETEKGKQG